MKKVLYISLMFVLVGIFSMSAYAAEGDYKAEILFLKGDVKVDPQGNNEWVAAEIGMELKQGTKLKTGADSFAELVFDKEKLNVINVAENTALTIDILSDSLSRIGLPNGKVLAKLEGLKKSSTFQVRTPTAVCGASGTGFGIEVFEGITIIQAFEDVIFVQGIGLNGEPLSVVVEVPAGWKTAVKNGQNPTPPSEMIANELLVWNAWVKAVAKRIEEAKTEEMEAEQEAEQPQRPEGSRYE